MWNERLNIGNPGKLSTVSVILRPSVPPGLFVTCVSPQGLSSLDGSTTLQRIGPDYGMVLSIAVSLLSRSDNSVRQKSGLSMVGMDHGHVGARMRGGCHLSTFCPSPGAIVLGCFTVSFRHTSNLVGGVKSIIVTVALRSSYLIAVR